MDDETTSAKGKKQRKGKRKGAAMPPLRVVD